MIESPVLRDLVAEFRQADILLVLRQRFGEVPADLEAALKGVREPERQKAMAVNLHRLGLALNYGDDPRIRDTTVLNAVHCARRTSRRATPASVKA